MRILKTFCFFVVLFFLFGIKIFNYDRFPPMGHLEEYAYSWLGIHLIETGIPQTWSPAGKFPSQDISFSGKIVGFNTSLSVDILAPWLDLPPLYGLLSGGVAHLYGANKWSVLPAAYIRLPAIFLATGTTIILFLLVKKLFNFWLAMLVMIVYSLTPTFVFAQRLSVAENGITFLYLLTVYLTFLYAQRQRWYLLIWLPLFGGLAGLMKQTGFFVAVFAVFWLIKKKLWREAFFVFAGTLPFLISLFVYGWAVNWEVFTRVSFNQSNRPVGFSSLPFIFSSPGYSIDFFFDGWYVFSILAMGYLAIRKLIEERYQLVICAFIFWAMVVVFSAGQTDVLLWYHYPFFPFLAISGTLVLVEIARRPTLVTSILVIGMLLSGRTLLSNEFRPEIKPMEFRFLVLFLLLPSVLYFLFGRELFRRLSGWVIIGVMFVGLFLNAQAIYSAFPLASAGKSFPFGPGTFLNEFHLPVVWRLLLRE